MAKRTKAERSASARKAARTRKKNHLKRSVSAKKGAKHRKGAKRNASKVTRRKGTRSPAQRAATARMLAANRARGGGGARKARKGRKGRKKSSGLARVSTGLSRSSGKTTSKTLVRDVASLKNFARAQIAFNSIVAPAVTAVYKAKGWSMPKIGGPRGLASGR